MDENYKDGDEILHKQILDEKTPSPQTNDSAEASDNDSDNAFPLFLSFRANDPIASVSEGIHEKYTNKPESAKPDMEHTDSPLSQDDNFMDPVPNKADPLFVPPTLMEIPVFKPFESKFEESQEPSYDIPQVFSSKAADRTSDGPYNPVRNQAYENEIHSVESYEVEEHKPVSPGKSIRPVVPDAFTARPGTRYSPAQQMGNIVPLANREKNTKRSKARSARTKIFFILMSVLAIIAAVVIWNTIDPNHPVTEFLGLAPDVTLSSKISTPSVTTSKPAADVTVKPDQTTAAAVETTAKETTKQTTEATKETTAATTVESSAPPASDAPAMTPSGFSSYISGGKSDDDNASFNIVFKNQGNSDVSFYDGIEYITVTFVTGGIKITEVTSNEFTFTADPDKSNTFIGIPSDKEVIAVSDSKTVAVSAASAGDSIGKYSVKYYIKGYT